MQSSMILSEKISTLNNIDSTVCVDLPENGSSSKKPANHTLKFTFSKSYFNLKNTSIRGPDGTTLYHIETPPRDNFLARGPTIVSRLNYRSEIDAKTTGIAVTKEHVATIEWFKFNNSADTITFPGQKAIPTSEYMPKKGWPSR